MNPQYLIEYSNTLLLYLDYVETPKKEEKPVERPRPKSSRHVRQSINKPIYIGADFPGMLYAKS